MVFRGITTLSSGEVLEKKSSRFHSGTFKSSHNRRKHQTDKERRDEAETHAVLESFKQSFLPERMDRPKAWVAAGQLNPETGVENRGVKRKLYLPPKALNNPSKRRSLPSRFDRKDKKEEPIKRLSQRQRARMMRAAKRPSRVGSKLVGSASRKRSGRKAIEAIMMENEASKRAQKAIGLPTPPKPEPQVSTNLYVANLPKDISKTDLQVLFGKFGTLDSIKIYEPRTEEERRRKKTIGFVSFSRRKDAENALDALNDKILFPRWQEKIRLGWGNPLSKGPASTLPGSAAILAASLLASHRPEQASVTVPKGATVHEINIPEDSATKRTIDKLAINVAKDGMVFENLVISRNRNNKKFDFLFNTKSPEHMYYRWRTISLCFGDSLQGWSESPFQVIRDGIWWVPPRVPKTRPPNPYQRADDRDRRSTRSRDSSRRDRSRSRERREKRPSKRRTGLIPVGSRPLSESDRTTFMNLLRQLSDKRHNIREAMAFCLDNSDKCTEIVEIIAESLTIDRTKVAKKLARLFLVSDILHNSQAMVKNASAYRSELQKRLRDIFKSIRKCWEDKEQSEERDNFEQNVVTVLAVWERWSLFPAFFVEGLRGIFKPELVKKKPPKEKKKKKTEELDDILALALAGDLDAVDEDLDGEPLSEDDLDGEPLDADQTAADDVDGEPLEEDDGDVDGIPM